jgi:UDP-galactopyranose mutase
MMLPFSRHLEADAVVFDAMDELSKFKFAPPKLLELEQELIDKASLVFTGGSSLFEAKKDRHPSVHCFPSSVDRTHFAKARAQLFDPADQEDLPKPRLGFYGVIDERFDIELLDRIAEMRPDWSFVMVGPVVKISEDDLPRRHNICYLGGKTYQQLPAYLSGWDVALMPFAMNESTQFISPTKTPEYLAGGKPVVSTPVKDVVRHYGHLQGVQIASTAEEFVAACEKALELARNPESGWLAEADVMLSATSWDTTQARMAGLIAEALGEPAASESSALLVAAE